ncbi:DUF207 domain protein [Talaromyces stipitatus ATCC 10500]|uniref:tRNA(Phe) 7-[(3-amino-3-carboxypropyl)-4-demethylwyosine(37)-N(4)]-methyltransferase n=1 Tax=Talaromyces stipitatus (strain ATCC 10500 / CBS 375.48 / QM 6759 / NRRL 1006) TaxID=441959 RepID=B8M6G8_TALSN|nr:DUF207 domain protein [Talaromyces stipitatus ATCC 10500]EED19343.1 DUF207 domain protein [Talaromyces stipitatus ATCC 10500]
MIAPLQYGDATIPPGFVARKSKILSDLSVPDAEYTDLSPKGSVDEGIRDLIRDINALDGLVTTSSCAGRVSVFVEGSKKTKKKQKTDTISAADEESQAVNQAASQVKGQFEDEKTENEDRDGREGGRMFAPSGGKGEGRWLYVSHDPVDNIKSSYHELFGLVPGDGVPKTSTSSDASIRLIRFHYDPMILHVMAATLHHAHPVLAAASHAGFRESGLQSLRCLEVSHSSGPNQHLTDTASHSPIVAVRSSGLALESVIGYCEYVEDDSEPVMRSLVTEEYLRMLVALANDRFGVNKERVERFQNRLLDLYKMGLDGTPNTAHKRQPPDWEDPQARKERKRIEGLKRQAETTRQKESALKPEFDETDIDMNIDF